MKKNVLEKEVLEKEALAQETRSKESERALESIELAIWTLITAIAISGTVYYSFGNGRLSLYGTRSVYLTGLVAPLFVILHKLIFGVYPIQRIRLSKNKEKLDSIFSRLMEIIKLENRIEESDDIIKNAREQVLEELSKENEQYALLRYSEQSREISKDIYTRGGVHLLTGCLIAFAGILFFYFQLPKNDISDTLLDSDTFDKHKLVFIYRITIQYLPRISTLIFVEIIAFFFLKQYRLTMEEFRYYEAIKRQRENQYTIIKVFNNEKYSTEQASQIVEKCSFGENPNKLILNETTQIIESAKNISQEANLIDKITEIIKASKK